MSAPKPSNPGTQRAYIAIYVDFPLGASDVAGRVEGYLSAIKKIHPDWNLDWDGSWQNVEPEDLDAQDYEAELNAQEPCCPDCGSSVYGEHQGECPSLPRR